MSTYPEIWLETQPPRAAFDARSNTIVGTLLVDESRVTFLHDHVTDLLEPIYSVSIGRRGSDFFNRWIELHYGDEAEQKVVYLKDGAHRGWHSTFARTH